VDGTKDKEAGIMGHEEAANGSNTGQKIL